MAAQDDRLTTLNLLNLDIMGSFIGITGLLLFILISHTSKNILLNSFLANGQSRSTVSLDEAAFVGRILLVLAGFISANTTTIRLKLLTQRVIHNESIVGTLLPNIWLTRGIWTSLAGGIMGLVGDYIRVQQSPRLPVAE